MCRAREQSGARALTHAHKITIRTAISFQAASFRSEVIIGVDQKDAKTSESEKLNTRLQPLDRSSVRVFGLVSTMELSRNLD